jgi:hypothetical protein
MTTADSRPSSAQTEYADRISSAEGQLNALAALLGRQAAAEAWALGDFANAET